MKNKIKKNSLNRNHKNHNVLIRKNKMQIQKKVNKMTKNNNYNNNNNNNNNFNRIQLNYNFNFQGKSWLLNKKNNNCNSRLKNKKLITRK